VRAWVFLCAAHRRSAMQAQRTTGWTPSKRRRSSPASSRAACAVRPHAGFCYCGYCCRHIPLWLTRMRRPHAVHCALQHGPGHVGAWQARRGADRLGLRCCQHVHHDAHGRRGPGPDGYPRLCAVPALCWPAHCRRRPQLRRLQVGPLA
jgi:hypothetical protein